MTSAERKAELDRALEGFGMVGQRLLSETDQLRVWRIELQPGERVAFHTHVLNYFWTATSAGRSRSTYADGRVAETDYQVGTNEASPSGRAKRWCTTSRTSATRLSFTTVELKLGSAMRRFPCLVTAEN